MKSALSSFQSLPLKDAARQILAKLGYKSDKFIAGAASTPQAFLDLFGSGHAFDQAKALVPEWKTGDEDAAAEFESAQTDLEGALDELESACDDLEAAEDKDEREDAQEQISESLEDVLNHFDEVMPLAVVANAVDPQLLAECKAKLAEITALPPEARAACLPAWLDKSPDAKERERKLNCFLRVFAEAKRKGT